MESGNSTASPFRWSLPVYGALAGVVQAVFWFGLAESAWLSVGKEAWFAIACVVWGALFGTVLAAGLRRARLLLFLLLAGAIGGLVGGLLGRAVQSAIWASLAYPTSVLLSAPMGTWSIFVASGAVFGASLALGLPGGGSGSFLLLPFSGALGAVAGTLLDALLDTHLGLTGGACVGAGPMQAGRYDVICGLLGRGAWSAIWGFVTSGAFSLVLTHARSSSAPAPDTREAKRK